MLQAVFDACTENNECIVLDNTVKSNNVEDMVFWYKADIGLPEFRIASDKIWKVHYKYHRTYAEMEKLKATYAAESKKKNRITRVCKSPAEDVETQGAQGEEDPQPAL